MYIKCGWAEFVNPTDGAIVARGSVSARAIPGVGRAYWDGEVRLLRGHEDLLDISKQLWLLRFEQGLAERWVELSTVERRWAPSGLRATAIVRSYDREVPPVVNELGGE